MTSGNIRLVIFLDLYKRYMMIAWNSGLILDECGGVGEEIRLEHVTSTNSPTIIIHAHTHTHIMTSEHSSALIQWDDFGVKLNK